MRALILLAACAIAAPVWAQDAPPRPAPPPAPPGVPEGGHGDEGGGAPGANSSAALPQLAPFLHVSGLTLENAETVSKDLEGLENTLYACPNCHSVAYEPGTCCDRPREEHKGLAIASAAPNPTASTISFVVTPARCVRLTELEQALALHHIEVLPDRLHLSGRVTLQVDGLVDAGVARAVADELVAAKLFEEVEVGKPCDGHVELIVRRPAPAPAPLLHVRDVLAKIAPDAKVTDVIWAGVIAS
jgi:hypothetical protein